MVVDQPDKHLKIELGTNKTHKSMVTCRRMYGIMAWMANDTQFITNMLSYIQNTYSVKTL